MENNELKKQSMHIAALVLGIISICTVFFWYISIPTGILAIVFGVKSTKRTGSKLAKAGLITGIVGISLCLFCYIGLLVLLFLSTL